MIGRIRVTKAVAAAGNYAAGDVISESATVGTPWVFQLNPDARRIVGAKLEVETTGQIQPCTLLLFKSDPRTWATPPVLNDNVTNTAPIHAHVADFVGAIELPALKSLGTGTSWVIASPSTFGNLPLEIQTEPTTGKLYVLLVTEAAFTNETSGDDYIIELEWE